MHSYNGIKNIIFDLGEVILDLAPEKTLKAFNDLVGHDTSESYSFETQNSTFDLLETGMISPKEFRDRMKSHTDKNITDEEIDHAWNAMLVDIPEEKLRVAQNIRKKYKTFVLSNTNSIHIDWVNKHLANKNLKPGLEPYFDFVYYSHNIGFRKPDEQAYLFIITKHHIEPGETLFIDDRPENIDAARKIGLKTHHLQNRHDFFGLFKDYM